MMNGFPVILANEPLIRPIRTTGDRYNMVISLVEGNCYSSTFFADSPKACGSTVYLVQNDSDGFPPSIYR